MAEKKNEIIRKAKKEMNYLTGDAAVQRLAELREKYILDQKAIEDAGYDKGLRDGISQGISQGLDQGRTEQKKKIAKNLLKLKMSIEQIKEVTGLTEEEIKNLK